MPVRPVLVLILVILIPHSHGVLIAAYAAAPGSSMKFTVPKLLLHSEGAVVLIASCVLYRELGASWLTFAILFLAPDLSMLGYLAGTKIGADAYNAVHTYVGPFLVWSLVYLTHRPSLLPFCVIWIAHIGFDRLCGYGLKYESGFKDTHLNRV